MYIPICVLFPRAHYIKADNSDRYFTPSAFSSLFSYIQLLNVVSYWSQIKYFRNAFNKQFSKSSKANVELLHLLIKDTLCYIYFWIQYCLTQKFKHLQYPPAQKRSSNDFLTRIFLNAQNRSICPYRELISIMNTVSSRRLQLTSTKPKATILTLIIKEAYENWILSNLVIIIIFTYTS